nr:hypothetical protein [Gloeochaete wittrockiana]
MNISRYFTSKVGVDMAKSLLEPGRFATCRCTLLWRYGPVRSFYY